MSIITYPIYKHSSCDNNNSPAGNKSFGMMLLFNLVLSAMFLGGLLFLSFHLCGEKIKQVEIEARLELNKNKIQVKSKVSETSELSAITIEGQ